LGGINLVVKRLFENRILVRIDNRVSSIHMQAHSNRYTAKVCFFCLSLLTYVVGCSETPQLIENNDPSKYTLAEDVLWASPDGFELTMDIYTPKAGSAPYPVLVMFHGGGWLINDNSIMDQASAYLATHGRYVICNVNYRLLADNDNTVTLDQIVEDAFGAVLWVADNIDRYKGDGSRIAVTGDSAGGHLTAMVVNSGHRLSSAGLGGDPSGFTPSYLPDGQSAEDIALRGGLKVQAAIPNYGAYNFYQSALDGFEGWANIFWLIGGALPRGVFGDDINAIDNPEYYQAVSPINHIPQDDQRMLPPQLVTVGSEDALVTPASVKEYVNKLAAAGQPVEYWEYAGRPHAYLDSGSNAVLGIEFSKDAPPALDVMIRFLDGVFYE
jgi:acetyl esterase